MQPSGINQYQKVKTHTGVMDADPHQLVMMLLDGAMDRIHSAKGHMQRNELAPKGEAISSAISIIGGLQASLDREAGGDVAGNLDRLYDYMSLRLLEGSRENDVAVLDEVGGLLGTVREGWAGIRETINNGDVALSAAN